MPGWLTLHVGALVMTGALFGGMLFFAAVFTPLVFKFCEREDAASFLRQVFPVYHRLMAGLCVAPAVLLMPAGRAYTAEFVTLLAVAALFLVAARILTPAADAARQAGNQARFRALHRASVAVHTLQLAALLVVFVRLAQ